MRPSDTGFWGARGSGGATLQMGLGQGNAAAVVLDAGGILEHPVTGTAAVALAWYLWRPRLCTMEV
jgi:hypothetical protein